MSQKKAPQWTNEQDHILFDHYPHTPIKELAEILGRSARSVYTRANNFGWKKAQPYLDSPLSGRKLKGMRTSIATEFKKGNTSWNTGLRLESKGRMRETQFKQGDRPYNYKPIGSERINSGDGYALVKVSDTGTNRQRWRLKHVLVWEAEHGPVPADHVITFIDGNRQNITLENLECIPRAEHALRHGINSYPPELANLVRLRGSLNRIINKRKSHEPK